MLFEYTGCVSEAREESFPVCRGLGSHFFVSDLVHVLGHAVGSLKKSLGGVSGPAVPSSTPSFWSQGICPWSCTFGPSWSFSPRRGGPGGPALIVAPVGAMHRTGCCSTQLLSAAVGTFSPTDGGGKGLGCAGICSRGLSPAGSSCLAWGPYRWDSSSGHGTPRPLCPSTTR